MNVWKYAVGITLIVYPALRLVGGIGYVETVITAVCIGLGLYILIESVIEAAARRARETWKR